MAIMILWMMLSLTVISSLALFLSFLLNRRNCKGDTWQLADGPVFRVVPGFICNSLNKNKLEFLNQILGKFGWTLAFKGPWFANMDTVITSDPMNVHHILTKNFTNYSKGKTLQELFEVLGDSILMADYESWKIQRKPYQYLIKNSNVERHLKNITQRKVEKGLFPVLDHFSEQGIMVDMQDVFKRFTFDTSGQLVFGLDPNCLSVEFPEINYYKEFDEIQDAVFHRAMVPECWWKLQKWLQIGEEKKLTRAWRSVDKFLYECISLKQEKLIRRKTQMEEEEELDLLTAFMVAEEGKSNKFVRDVAAGLLIAGRESISVALTWFFWLLATNPSVENKILQEIKANIQIDNQHHQDWLNSEQIIDRLVYLHAALCETLRLYPPAPINYRSAVQADTLPSGHHINQNAKIVLCIYSMGRMEEIWGKDCLKFKPERWISEKGFIVQVPSHKFPTFGAGPRTCLGRDISLIQMKMVAASVIWNYRIQVAEGQLVSPKNSFALYMKNGLKVRIFKRHSL